MGKPTSSNYNRNMTKKEINQEKDARRIKQQTFKKKKPLKRNELIAQAEKTKLYHKYKKMMRKEAKVNTQQNEKKAVKEKFQDNRVDFKKSESVNRNNINNKNDRNNKVDVKKRQNDKDDKKYRTVNQRAQTLYEEKQLEKQKQQEEREKKEAEKRDAKKKYKSAKKEKFKKLCNKTKSGQILMSKQMDLILNKIQKNSSK